MTDTERTSAEPTATGPTGDASPETPGPGVSPVPTWYADQPRADEFRADEFRAGQPSTEQTAVQPRPDRGADHGVDAWSDRTAVLDRPGATPAGGSSYGSPYPPRQQGYEQAYQPYQGQGQDPWTAAGQAAWSPSGPAWSDDTAARPASGSVDTLGRAPRRRGGRGLVVLAVVLALLAGLVGGAAGSVLAARAGLLALPGSGGAAADGSASGAAPGETSAGQVEPLPPGETGTVAEIAAQVLPSVVSIRVSAGAGQGTGSGFVIDADGLILTNNHVIAAGGPTPADDIVVELGDGSQATAEVVGTEPSYDIAVLRIDPADVGTPLVSLPFGDSDRVVVGEQVVAVGAPLGLDSTVTTGIVSALNRPVSAGDAQQTAFINAIQTDAAINPGNSGGPLVNMRGEVVGVNSAIAQAPGGQVGGSIGLGFSIPSNQAERTAGQLVTDGVATFPVVGVLLDRSYTGEGVRIVSEDDATDAAPVTPGGPADEAGLRAGDVILAFEGRPMTESDELVVAIRAREPGDEVTLTVRRGEEVFDVDLVLQEGERP